MRFLEASLDPVFFICHMLGKLFSHTSSNPIPPPPTTRARMRKAPPDTSDRPPTFQKYSAETDPDVILIAKPSLAPCPLLRLLPSHPEVAAVFPGTDPLEELPGFWKNSCFFFLYSGLKFCINWKNTQETGWMKPRPLYVCVRACVWLASLPRQGRAGGGAEWRVGPNPLPQLCDPGPGCKLLPHQ